MDFRFQPLPSETLLESGGNIGCGMTRFIVLGRSLFRIVFDGLNAFYGCLLVVYLLGFLRALGKTERNDAIIRV